jgi:glycosyltransferase involved in cell wall biosynthesis
MLRLYQTERQRQANLGAFRYVVVASRHMAEEYRRHGVPADRIQIVSLFAPEVTPLENPPTPQGRSNRILLMGRLTRLKGGDHLIEALPLAADRLGRRLTLIVAGDGSERPRLETLARRRGVPAEFHGWVSGPKRDVITCGVDLIAVPSLWPEPFGLVGIEAGCLGVPAIGYAVGGIPDWLIPGVSGESAPGDALVPDSLADAIVRALADDHHWNRLRHGAWETARRFNPEAHLQKLEQIFQHAVG